MLNGLALDGMRADFPNLKLTTLDHCHASGRLTKRTFKADDLLHSIMEQDVRDKKSMCQIIEHSPAIKTEFGKVLRQSSSAPFQTQAKNCT